MYARLTTFQLHPDRVDQLRQIYLDQFLPDALSSWTGFQAGYLLGDEDGGNATIVSFWNTKDDALATDESGQYEDRLHLFASLITFPPVTDGYQVLADPQDAA